MNISKTLDLSDPYQIEGEKLLTYWIFDGLKPYETVENEQFLKFISHLCKKFKVPSEKTIRTKLVPDQTKAEPLLSPLIYGLLPVMTLLCPSLLIGLQLNLRGSLLY
ncbi:UNVERIFIED_CONTAM: hypothetical protein RMT77_017726 [Armadillidium vulgare]